MPDPIPTAQVDLTQAITTLLPAIMHLEASLRAMDEEALVRQTQMAEALDRIATSLETLPEGRADLLLALSEQKTTAAALAQATQSLDQRLITEGGNRTELAKTMAALIRLLEGPA